MFTRNVNGLFMRTDVKVVVKGIHREMEIRERRGLPYNTRCIDLYKLLLEMIFIMGYKLSFQISKQAI